MPESNLNLELHFQDTALNNYFANPALFYNLAKPFIKIEVIAVSTGIATDVTQAIERFSMNLHKNSVSSCTLEIPKASAASFPLNDKIRIWLGYTIEGTEYKYPAYEGFIKRNRYSHISMRNTITIQTFGLSYYLRELTGSELVEENTTTCTVTLTINPSSLDPTGVPGAYAIDMSGKRKVPKRWAGKAEELLRERLDISGIPYMLGNFLDYKIDVQLNFDSALQLIQHILSFAPLTHEWWDDALAIHIKGRTTSGVKQASGSMSGVKILSVSANTKGGTGTLTFQGSPLVVESQGYTLFQAHACAPSLQWTAPGDDMPGSAVSIEFENTTVFLYSKNGSYIQVEVVFNNLPFVELQTRSVVITEIVEPLIPEVTLTGVQFNLFNRDESKEVEKDIHTAHFITPYNPNIKLNSLIKLTDINIGADRLVLVDAISISSAHDSTRLEMDCKGEIVK